MNLEAVDTYPPGMALVVACVFAALAVISLLELICELRRWPSISYRVEQWSLRNPWYTGGLLVILGAFLAHFLLNPLPSASL